MSYVLYEIGGKTYNMNMDKLRELFEDNFEELKFETGRSINSNMKEFAWQQVKLYYEKLGEIAKDITEAEIKLTLPEQVTPNGKKYTIEGTVSVGEKEDKITMYHIKSHSYEEIKENRESYKGQLNLYAHMWKQLKGTQIDNMAIIASAPTTELREAISKDDEKLVKLLIDTWNPVVPLPFDDAEGENQIQSFGETVDKIEERQFKAPPLAKLKEIHKGQKAPFRTAVCRHCDARYSCKAYEKSATHVASGK